MQHCVVSVDPNTLLVVAGESFVGRPLSHWVRESDREDLARLLVVSARTPGRRVVRAVVRHQDGPWTPADLILSARLSASGVVLVDITIRRLSTAKSDPLSA